MKRRTVGYFVALVAVLVYASMAVAGPIPAVTPGTYAPPFLKFTGTPGIGESDLASPNAGVLSTPNVDWMVLAPETWTVLFPAWLALPAGAPHNGPIPVGDYLYLYQAENTNLAVGLVLADGSPCTDPVTQDCVPGGEAMTTLTIAIPGGTLGRVSTAGVLFTPVTCTAGGAPTAACTGDDLDKDSIYHPAHAITATGLDGPFNPADTSPLGAGTEEEGICPAGDFAGDSGLTNGLATGADSGFCINPQDPTTSQINQLTVTWTFDPSKPPHHETVTLYYSSPFAPVYGEAFLVDGAVWSTGLTNDDGVTGDPVPVPGQPSQVIPEPTTLVLFGGGLVALGLLRRKMKR